MGKPKKKKTATYSDDDEYNVAEPITQEESPAPIPETTLPDDETSTNLDLEGNDLGGLMGALAKSKKKEKKKEVVKEVPEDGRILTKKEKERLKKEYVPFG
jgi:hypothetical protein